ncbi:MAG: hypothetical protein C0485_17570 [Pirellula sp.]|nr:hypothetical protein [Pirellula sp.]
MDYLVAGPYKIEVDTAGRCFEFQVHRRELDLWGGLGADERSCRYHWMDGRQLRQGQGGPNFRTCVDFWWLQAEQNGDGGDPVALQTLALAECFPLINTARSMQEVYRDAHLRADTSIHSGSDVEGRTGRGQVEPNVALAEDEDARLRSVARLRNTTLIQQELERLFWGTRLTGTEQQDLDEQACQWLNGLVDASKSGGRDDLIRYTTTIDQLIRKLRRRGDIGSLRTFLNAFSYECKAAFYTCYASSWSAIVHTLERTEPENQLGHRLMRLWHHQNRPEYGHGRDAFCGQVLALHPLSRFMLTSSEHLEAIRKWIDHPSYDSITASGQVGQHDEYWNLCGSILVAAAEYDQSRERAESSREVHGNVRPDADRAISCNDEPTIAEALEDYFAARRIRCNCAGELNHLSHVPSADGEQSVVTMTCIACGRHSTHTLDVRDFIQSRR